MIQRYILTKNNQYADQMQELKELFLSLHNNGSLFFTTSSKSTDQGLFFDFYYNDFNFLSSCTFYQGSSREIESGIALRTWIKTNTFYNTFATVNTYAPSDNPEAEARKNDIHFCSNISFLYEVIIINKNTVALSFTSYVPENLDSRKSPGIIIITKTNKGNICTIKPSKIIGNVDYWFVADSTPKTYNHLEVLSPYSMSGTSFYDNIPWKPVYGSKTILNPILVNNSDEYVPDIYYTPVTQYIIDPHDDAIIDVNGDLYYYNGFIAVKIDTE
jgi:hypothetical protein